MARRGENIRKRKDGRWEGRYIKARTSEGKIQWGYVYGTVYAEVKRVLIQKKAEAGFYNLKRTNLTFEALAEVWLHPQRNAVKESTYAHYSYTLHKYLLPVLSKVPAASLEESFLEQAMQQIIAPAAGELLCPGMPLDVTAHLQICRALAPDSSDGAGSSIAKSHRQNFCAPLPGGAAAALSVCTGEPHAPQNWLIIRGGIGAAYWRDLRLTVGRFRPETRNAENQPDGLPNFL